MKQLEYKPDVFSPEHRPLSLTDRINIALVGDNFAFCGLEHSSDGKQHCCLAASARPADDCKFTFFNMKVDFIEGFDTAIFGSVDHTYIFKADHSYSFLSVRAGS